MFRRLAVFCGSSSGYHPSYLQAARATGSALAGRGIELVYGGGKVGLMGALADSCLASGGRVVGVMPRALVDKEIAHPQLTELRVVNSMHERKAQMADLSDGFIALPGGFGTWEEFCEVVTWSQLGLHRKACALLNVNGYYDPLLAMAQRAVEEGFLRDDHRRILLSDTDPSQLLDRLASYLVPQLDKWLDVESR